MKQKQKRELLPPNHPERPDWHFFSDILGRDLSPPPNCTIEEACGLLKAFFLESYVFHFDKLFAACGRGALESVKHSASFTGQGREDWLQFFKDKMLLPHDNAPDEKRIKDKDRGYSGNAVSYWEPEKCGVVPYVKARLDYIFKSIKPDDKPYSTTISLQKLAEMRLEPQEDGEWVRPSNIIEDTVEPSEALLNAIGTKDALDLTRHGESEKGWEYGDTDTSAVIREKRRLFESLAESNNAHLARLTDLRQRMTEGPDLDGCDRPEFAFFEMALGRFVTPMDSPEARAIQLREMAIEVIQHRGRTLLTPEDLAAGITFDDILADIKAWNPRDDTFIKCFPDAVDIIEKQLIHEAEAGVRNQLLEVQLRHSSAIADRRVKYLAKCLQTGEKAGKADSEFLAGINGLELGKAIPPAKMRWAAFRALHNTFAGFEQTETIQGEHRIIAESIKQWNPSQQTLGVACPDLVDKGIPLWRARIIAEISKPALKAGKTIVQATAEGRNIPAEEITALLFSKAEVRRLEGEGPETYVKPSPELAIKETRFWNTSARDQADMDNPGRPDFVYLAHYFGLPARRDIAPEEMHTIMRQLSPIFVEKLCFSIMEAKQTSYAFFSATKMNAMKAVSKHYNPAADGYLGECLQEAIRNPHFVMEQIRAKIGENKKPNTAQGSLFESVPALDTLTSEPSV